MEQSTLVPTGAGEQNLTPGEQRILSLLEQGQRRMERMEQRMHSLEASMEQGQRLMEQRMHSLEDKLGAQSQQLKELTLKVEHEAGASKMRDRQLAADIQRLRDEDRELIEYVNKEVGTFQKEVSERFAQHNTRLEVLEQTIQLNCEALRENTQALQGLQQEVRQLAVAVASKADASRVAALEQRLGL